MKALAPSIGILIMCFIALTMTVFTSCKQVSHDLNKYKVVLDVTYLDGSNEKITSTIKCYHDPSDEIYLYVKEHSSAPCIVYDGDDIVCGVRRFTIINIQKLD